MLCLPSDCQGEGSDSQRYKRRKPKDRGALYKEKHYPKPKQCHRNAFCSAAEPEDRRLVKAYSLNTETTAREPKKSSGHQPVPLQPGRAFGEESHKRRQGESMAGGRPQLRRQCFSHTGVTVSHATERLLSHPSPSQALDGGALARDNLSQVYCSLVCAGARSTCRSAWLTAASNFVSGDSLESHIINCSYSSQE